MHDLGAVQGSLDGAPVRAALGRFVGTADSFLDWLPIGIYACDRAGTVVQYNRRAAALWGRAPELGDPTTRYCGAWRAFTADGAAMPPAASPMAELLATGQPVEDREVAIERPDGARLTLLANLAPLHDPEGHFIGGVNCFQDITGRKQAEAMLRRREQHFTALLEALPAAIYTTDAAGRITFFNRAAAEAWGVEPEIGRTLWCGSWRIYTPDGAYLPHEQCPMAVALKEGRPVHGPEIVAERPDGTRLPLQVFPTPLRDETGAMTGAVNLLIDISARKQAERTQRLLIAELHHRVKNMLATVQAIAGQTLQGVPDPAAFMPSFTGRLQALARAHALLTQSNWRGTELSALLQEQMALNAWDPARVAFEGPPAVLEPQLALHLAMVLHELGTNARKYGALSSAAGRVRVAWSLEGDAPPWLALRWSESGAPRPAQDMPRGFGTELIKQSLRPHGGAARMTIGEDGVSWLVRVPLGAAAEGPARQSAQETPRPPAPEAAAARRVVLVVEDEPVLGLDIAAMLRRDGYAILGPAATIAEAREAIERAERLDAVLLDANLGGRRVDAVADALAARGVPFIFVSGYERETLPEAHRTAPLLQKPFNREQLLGMVRALFG